MMVHIERDRSNVNRDEVVNLYHAVGWTKHNRSNISNIMPAAIRYLPT
ncbi:hypothetical protein [Fictibacillus terranigra]|uniref:Uncharacterized protein n=1 Tax=Fictibacillus terranigra TaxID=3058424 RepID=A0ABT8ECH1_9BACL|nr:hypothetical protein [Fictibacillus sp. CENA-BCM004]MDN4075544.1 hypothetical protein [Fictibacillus sp. CENA-BCM004]